MLSICSAYARHIYTRVDTQLFFTFPLLFFTFLPVFCPLFFSFFTFFTFFTFFSSLPFVIVAHFFFTCGLPVDYLCFFLFFFTFLHVFFELRPFLLQLTHKFVIFLIFFSFFFAYAMHMLYFLALLF